MTRPLVSVASLLGLLLLVPMAQAQTKASYPPNYRAQIVVTDRVDEKAVASDTFTAVFSTTAKLSRIRPLANDANGGLLFPDSAAFELSVSGDSTLPVVGLMATAQLHLLPQRAGAADQGGDIAENVQVYVTLGKPYTMVDMVTDRAGRRRVTVQITLTRLTAE